MSSCQDVFCENRTLSGCYKLTACTKHQETIVLNEWIKVDDGFEYKNLGKNGHWEVIRWRHDIAYYSFCPFCGYIHSCCKSDKTEDGSWSFPIYAPEKEFNYCPMCGKHMKINKKLKIKV